MNSILKANVFSVIHCKSLINQTYICQSHYGVCLVGRSGDPQEGYVVSWLFWSSSLPGNAIFLVLQKRTRVQMVGKTLFKAVLSKKNTLIESIYCQHVKLTVTRSNFMISAVATRAVAIKLMYSLRRLELRLHRKIIRIISDKNLNLELINITWHFIVRTDHFGNEDRFKHSIVRCLWDILLSFICVFGDDAVDFFLFAQYD